jgi:glycosyltransferase involved in cell wall biosynthesis
VGGHRELVRHRDTGYLFPPDTPRHLAEGVSTALADRPSWPRIRAQAAEFIEKERLWSHSVARYAEVYGRILRR